MTLICDTCGEPIKNVSMAMLAWNGYDNPDFKILHHLTESPLRHERRDGCYLLHDGYTWDQHLRTVLRSDLNENAHKGVHGGFQECLGILLQYHASMETAVKLLLRLYGGSIKGN